MKIDFDMLFKILVGIVVAVVVMIILQMWMHLFHPLVFWKLIATLVLLGCLAGFLIAVKSDMADEKKLRNDKFLD